MRERIATLVDAMTIPALAFVAIVLLTGGGTLIVRDRPLPLNDLRSATVVVVVLLLLRHALDGDRSPVFRALTSAGTRLARFAAEAATRLPSL